MLVDQSAFRRPADVWSDLPGDEGLLLWSLRRLIVAWPRCHAVHAALHARYGDTALGVEHLLRCWLLAVSSRAHRRLVIGDPACALLLADEGTLLFVLRRTTPPAAAATALVDLTGDATAGALLPLAAALAEAAQL